MNWKEQLRPILKDWSVDEIENLLGWIEPIISSEKEKSFREGRSDAYKNVVEPLKDIHKQDLEKLIEDIPDEVEERWIDDNGMENLVKKPHQYLSVTKQQLREKWLK